MIYLFYGPNSYLIQEKLAALKARYLAKFASGLDFWRFDLEEGTGDLKAILDSQSLFESKKLVFLRGALSLLEGEWDGLEKLISRSNWADSKDAVLIFYDVTSADGKLGEGVKNRLGFFKKIGQLEEFKNLDRAGAVKWAAAQAQNLELRIGPVEIAALVDAVGLDNWRLHNELAKLKAFAVSELVSRVDIESVVSKEITANVFETISALARKDSAAALVNLANHWHNNEDPLMVLNMLAWQFRILLKLADPSLKNLSAAAAASKLKLNPWVVKKSLACLKNFTLPELKSFHQSLMEADIAVKTGLKDGREALEDLILSSPIYADINLRR